MRVGVAMAVGMGVAVDMPMAVGVAHAQRWPQLEALENPLPFHFRLPSSFSGDNFTKLTQENPYLPVGKS